MKADGRRARARPLCAALALACVLAGCDAEPTPAAAPSRQPAPSAPLACELGALSAHSGASVALAPGAIVLREAGAMRLVPLGEPAAQAIALDAQRVPPRGLARRGAGWLALAATADGPALLAVGPDRTVRRVALGAGTLEDGALAVQGERAIATWIGEGAVARVARIDLSRELATAPVALDGSGGGAPMAAAAAEGALVAFAAPGAPLFDVRETSARRSAAPGLVRALASTARGVAVLHEAPDRTGLWIAIEERSGVTVGRHLPPSAGAGMPSRSGATDGNDGAPPVRATQPDARPASPSLAAMEGGMLLVYRDGRDVFLQPLSAEGEPTAAPLVAGPAGGRAAAPLVAVDGDRFWIAWESAGESGPSIQVRAGRCRPR